jgi:hypothetical protein
MAIASELARIVHLLTTSHPRKNCPIARLLLARYGKNAMVHVTSGPRRLFDRGAAPVPDARPSHS